MAVLRAELSALKVRALTQRAEAEGVDEGSLDAAGDVDDIVELIIARRVEQAVRDAAQEVALRAELSGMKLRALTKRAEEVGVDETELDEAGGVEDLITLIVAVATAGPQHQPAAAPAPQPPELVERAEPRASEQSHTSLAVATEGHGDAHPAAAQADVPADVATTTVEDGTRQLFGSMRFGPKGILPEAKELQLALAEQNANMMIIDMAAGGDIDTNVFSGIEKCDTFLVFGTSGYGEDTGNQASTFYEYKHAFALKKRIVLIRMIPFGQNFEELQGRVIFNANKLILTWIEGEPMPPSLVADIHKAIADPSTAPPPAL